MYYIEEHPNRRMKIAVGVLIAVCVFLSVLLAGSYNKLASAGATFASMQEEQESIQAELVSTQEELLSVQAELSCLQDSYDSLASGYVYRNPAYEEMKSFIVTDHTNLNEYKVGEYTCLDFASEVKQHAMGQNFRCALVEIEFPGGAHALVAFDTTDHGMIYIEPQNDREAQVFIGEKYWEQWSGYYSSYDDTIERIRVIW
jgi:hypothetical protein